MTEENETPTTENTDVREDEKGGPEDFLRSIFGDDFEFRQVGPEELLKLLGVPDQEEAAETERLTDMALNMTSDQAARFAASALIGAGRESDIHHDDHARFRLEAASVWLSLAEFLERQERRASQPTPEQRIQTALRNIARESRRHPSGIAVDFPWAKHPSDHLHTATPEERDRWERAKENVTKADEEAQSSGNGE